MLKKIIAINNVGRFRNSAAPANPQLAKNVQIWGANGSGKTTLCAILRSLQRNEPDYVLGRRTLGSAGALEVELLTDSGVIRFTGGRWSQALPEIAIFDATFVAENVHAGEIVDLQNRRNLYYVIIGQDGAALAKQDTRLAEESRALTSEITAASRALRSQILPGVTLDEFARLSVDPDIDAKIVEQTKAMDAARQAQQIKARPALQEYTVPALPAGFADILQKTIAGIAADAEAQIATHLDAPAHMGLEKPVVAALVS